MLQANAPSGKALKDKMFSTRKARRGEEGSAIIELSLVVYFFIIPMLFGTAVVGMLVYDSIEVSQAAHEGASYASVAYRTNGKFSPTTLANVTTFALAAEPNVPASALTTPLTTNPVTVTWGCAAAGSTTLVTVTCTTTGAPIVCDSGTPNLFVRVQTEANVTPLFDLSFLGYPATVQFKGLSTFELNP
jgi:hypothetical protein